MRKTELDDRLKRIGIDIENSTIYSWYRTGWISHYPRTVPVERSIVRKDSRFKKKKQYSPGQTGDWDEASLRSIVDIWSVRNPQNDQIKPLPLDRLDNALFMAYTIQFETTAMFPLDWGVPNFHRSYYEVDETDRWLVSDELHPYVVRLICTRQKLLHEIHVKNPVKVNLTWEEEPMEHSSETQAERTRYRLKPITLDRNVELDTVEMRVVTLERRTDEGNGPETKKDVTQSNSLIFWYEIDDMLRALPKKGADA